MRGACFCIGPQPGETLCPCRLRAESDADRRIRQLEAENRRLRMGGAGRLRDQIGTFPPYERIGP